MDIISTLYTCKHTHTHIYIYIFGKCMCINIHNVYTMFTQI